MRTRSAIAERPVRRLGPGRDESTRDTVLVEEPLEIRVHGDPIAVTMRTPGHDRELAVGFLFAEGLLHSVDDVGSVFPCGRPDEEGYGNTLEVTPASGHRFDPDLLRLSRRGTLTTAACGVCGRTSVEDLISLAGRVETTLQLPAARIASSTERLRTAQPAFAATGGAHAAALLDAEGAVLASYEDVGRHNAVDKTVGALVLGGRLRREASRSAGPAALLAVSGRASFEIVQKALMARVPFIAAVSAPSSLAVDLAERTGITLAGFVRGGGLNLYTHASRVLP